MTDTVPMVQFTRPDPSSLSAPFTMEVIRDVDGASEGPRKVYLVTRLDGTSWFLVTYLMVDLHPNAKSWHGLFSWDSDGEPLFPTDAEQAKAGHKRMYDLVGVDPDYDRIGLTDMEPLLGLLGDPRSIKEIPLVKRINRRSLPLDTPRPTQEHIDVIHDAKRSDELDRNRWAAERAANAAGLDS